MSNSMTQINNIFTASPKSVSQALMQGFGLYIPAYQRNYSWDRNKVNKLIENMLHGLEILTTKQDSITFIGSIIVINDNKNTTISPSIRNQIPSSVWLIIDGQQRLTTLLLIFIELHSLIKKGIKGVNRSTASKELVWLLNQTQQILPRLEKTFILDMEYSEDNLEINKYYPRMIRAFEDSWARNSHESKYSSPIAHYIRNYISYNKSSSDEASKEFLMNPFSSYSEGIEKIFRDNIKKIRSMLNNISNDFKSSEFDDLNLNNLLASDTIKDTLFLTDDFPDINGLSEEKDKSIFRNLLPLIIFSKFILERTCLTVVEVRNEDYAFDMFEALNTTGEPLTAFETFKPIIIRDVGLDTYIHSEEKELVDIIESYLNKDEKNKSKVTSDLLIPFRLSEDGEKLSRKLSEQRYYLNSAYNTTHNKLIFLRRLSYASEFMSNIWIKHDSDIISQFDDVTNFYLNFMKEIKHTIVLGVLFRFFTKYKENDGSISEIAEAIRICGAFSLLWRASHSNTKGIDTIYRDLIQQKVSSKVLDSIDRLNTDIIKSYFVEILRKNDLLSKSEWIDKTVDNPIYSAGTNISKFILLFSYQDSIIDEVNRGMIKVGNKGCNDIISSYKSSNDIEVEHIAPQKASLGAWDDQIYHLEQTKHTIGNLTILPKKANCSIGNASWEKKRALYRALSSRDPEKRESLLQRSHLEGLVTKRTIEVIQESKFLSSVESISMVDQSWNINIIKQRGKNLLSLAYDKIFAEVE